MFASCDSSGGDEGGDDKPPVTEPPEVAGPAPAGIKIVSWPTNDSYEGLPLDLTGLEVRVSYGDRYDHYDILTATPGTFSTYPPYAVGVIAKGEIMPAPGENAVDTTIWVPQLKYTLLWYSKDAKKTFSIPLDLQDENSKAVKDALAKGKPLPTVQPVARAKEWTSLTDGDTPLAYVYNQGVEDLTWSKGLHFTGPDSGLKRFVDDVPDFGGFKLQADYADAAKKTIGINPDIEWRIVPEYQYAATDTKKENPTWAKGGLFVTIGKNPIANDEGPVHPYVQDALDKKTAELKAAKLMAADKKLTQYKSTGDKEILADPALTVSHPYDEIYIVKAIEVPITADDLGFFFYWMDDKEDAWLDKLKATDKKITVSYTGTTETRQFTAKELVDLNGVWYNVVFNPADPLTFENSVPFAVRGVYDSSTSKTGKVEHAKNKTPQITVGYRGVYAYIDVPVYTKLTGFVVSSPDGGAVPVSMEGRDNDSGTMSAAVFDSKVTVTATFSAYSDSEKSADWIVHFDTSDSGADTVNDRTTEAGPPPVTITASGNKGAPDRPDNYSSNFYDVSHNPKNNGKDANVTFYYASIDKSNDDKIKVGSTLKSARQAVSWTHIPGEEE